MSSESLKQLRVEQRYQEAIELGKSIMVASPDKQVFSEVAWCYYYLIKSAVNDLQQCASHDQTRLNIHSAATVDLLRGYVRFLNQYEQKASLQLSNIMRSLAKIAEHIDEYPDIVRWLTFDGLTNQDWKYNDFNGEKVKPVAYVISRGLAKWIKERSDVKPEVLELAIGWLEKQQKYLDADDAIWVEWDLSLMLHRKGAFDAAAETLVRVLKTKRKDSWAWCEAARLYSHSQPSLSISCYCQALLCPTQEEFVVNVHMELASILANERDYVNASIEVSEAIRVRQFKGWRIPQGLQELRNAAWFKEVDDFTSKAKQFYKENSQAALQLCYSNVVSTEANYIGKISLDHSSAMSSGRVRHIVAVRSNNGMCVKHLTQLPRSIRYLCGDPLNLQIGVDDNGTFTILNYSKRHDGSPWDCLTCIDGVIVETSASKHRQRVFVNSDNSYIPIHSSCLGYDAGLHLGAIVKVGVVYDTKRKQLEVIFVAACDTPNNPNIRQYSGSLKRLPKGFAFVDDVFVPNSLLASIGAPVISVQGIAIYNKNPKTGSNSWAAVTISPL